MESEEVSNIHKVSRAINNSILKIHNMIPLTVEQGKTQCLEFFNLKWVGFGKVVLNNNKLGVEFIYMHILIFLVGYIII